MRSIVIDLIRKSKWYIACIDNGLADEIPELEKLGDLELIDMYVFSIAKSE